MKVPSKSALKNEKKRKALEEMERERADEALREEERFKPVDAIVEAIERLIEAKQDGEGSWQASNDLKDTIIEAIRSFK